MSATANEARPLYLTEPNLEGHSYGRVSFDEDSGKYTIDAEPAVLEMAKRLFPGSGTGRRDDRGVSFKATKRAVGDLNWLLLRFPMVIEDLERFNDDRHRAIDHAQRRQQNEVLQPSTPPAVFKGDLYPYQAEGVSFLVANERTLLADDMGLGKTVTALAALATANAFPAVVVVPPTVQRQWALMAEAFLAMRPEDELFGTIAHTIKGQKVHELPSRPLYIVHYGLLYYWRDALLEMGLKCIIFDEIQELRRTGTLKYSAASLVAGDCDLAWGLSGTPIYNYGSEIWAVLNILEYHCLGDSDSFTREWCHGYGSETVEKPDVLGDYLRREGLMLRRRKVDVQGQLPAKRRIVVDVEHDHGIYRRMIQPAVKLARGYDGIKDWNQKGQAKREIEATTRQASGVAKAPHVAEFVHSLISSGERVLVFSYHHQVHELIADHVKRHASVVRITGKETAKQKAEAVQTFADGKADAVLLSLRTAAGLDGLQGAGTCVVFAELDWSPAIHSQCEDRLHRIGFEGESLLSYYLVSNTGYDGVMQEALGLKVGQFIGLMGDDVECEDDKALAGEAAQKHMNQVIERLKRGG